MEIFRCILLLMVLFPFIAKADALVAVDIKRLSFESTIKIVQSAITACRKQAIQIAVVVIDRGGNVQLAARDTLAVDLTLRVAEQKAYTALSFNMATSI
ncbi:MAG: heme-binding protein, partial [Gammaproteobacteria bacterium]|nr:heme-binding protein [Gammaproteobacteria bacterium]